MLKQLKMLSIVCVTILYREHCPVFTEKPVFELLVTQWAQMWAMSRMLGDISQHYK